MENEDQQRVTFGPFELDPARHLLLHRQQPLALKPKVFDLLVLLVENQGRLISKRELMERLWGDRIVEEANLTQSVYELRRVLGEDGQGFLVTIPRRGYRFEAPVQPHAAEPKRNEDVDAPRTLAVLPFRPIPLPGGEERGDEPLEFGIAETLISALSGMPGLLVRPVDSVQAYSRSRRDRLAAGRELGAEVVLDGSIQRAGERLRATAQLVRVTDGAVLWAEKFDCMFHDIFAVQDSICEQLIGALTLEIPLDLRRSSVPVEDPNVHQLFLECRYHWHRWTPEGWKRSIECGRAVLEAEPKHARASAWAAASYCTLGCAGLIPPREAFREAKELVEHALGLDSTLSVAHEVRGAVALFHEWDWDRAQRSARWSIELNPSSGRARDLLALTKIVTGDPDAALREVDRALDVDPLSLIVNTDAGNVAYYARDDDRALAAIGRALELDPWFAHAHRALGFVRLLMGRPDEALAAFEAAIEMSGGDSSTSGEVGYAMAVCGARQEAREILASLIAKSESDFVDPYRPALVCVGLGDTDQALDWLERALEVRSRELIYLRADPIFDVLHGVPRFEELTRSIGL